MTSAIVNKRYISRQFLSLTTSTNIIIDPFSKIKTVDSRSFLIKIGPLLLKVIFVDDQISLLGCFLNLNNLWDTDLVIFLFIRIS